MTRRYVTDEQYGNLWRRATELVRRVDEGTISYNPVMDGLQTLIEGSAEPEPVYDIVVDYNRSLAEMIKAGNYDWVGSDINEKHFRLEGKGRHKLSATLFYFNRYIESKDAIAEMDKQGYRPARIEELLAFGEKYPEVIRRTLAIVALGSIWRDPNGDRHMPYLDWCNEPRALNLAWFDTSYEPLWSFLAVRK